MGNKLSQGADKLGLRRRKKTNENSLPPSDISSPIPNNVNANSSASNDSNRYTPSPAANKPLPSPPGIVKVRALYSFQGISEDDLSFKKGDIMEVEQDIVDSNAEDWWYATNYVTRETGYIPSNYVTLEVTKSRTNIESQDWWFDIDHHEADKMLLLPSQKKGTFLIRKTKDGMSYALSMLDYDRENDEPRVKHYKIKKLDDGRGYFINSQKTFEDMPALIAFYSKNANGLCGNLTRPCPRIRPALQFRQLEVKREAVKLSSKLGQGNFGEVWKAKYMKIIDVAVKTLKSGTMSAEEFLEEAKIMHTLTHPRLVMLMAVVSREEPFWIITELMKHGALLSFIRNEGAHLGFSQLVNMCSQIAEGMEYLESKNYIHRDLRAANILVGDHNEVKVADFGLARFVDDFAYTANQQTKFPVKWTAPEAATHNLFSTKSDVWSFGVLMYEIITYGKVPYPGMPNNEVIQLIERGGRMERPKDCPKHYYELMLQCWKQKPEDRLTFESLHDTFDNYTINTEEKYD